MLATTPRLRPMTAEDAAAVTGPRLPDWAPDYPGDQEVEIAGFLAAGQFAYATLAEPWGPWIVLVDGLEVGGAGFHGPPTDGAAEIGYNLSPSYRGRGIATAAVAMLADLAMTAGATYLVAGTDPGNAPSQRVLERAGFRRTEDRDGEFRWIFPLTD